MVTGGEACEDLNEIDGDGCSADCTSDETCGNGVVDVARGETCDDANSTSGDGCSARCQTSELCGNGLVEGNEQCDNGVATPGCDVDCTAALCGDATLNPTIEECDAGGNNSNASDATCRTNCRPRRCGDDVVDHGHGESCDDGNTTPGDGCNASCTGP